jgi:hypothetical protein
MCRVQPRLKISVGRSCYDRQVVALTGDTNPLTLKEAHELGVNSLHQKPCKFEDSVALMRRLYTHWSNALRPDR